MKFNNANDVIEALRNSNSGEFWIKETETEFLVSEQIGRGVMATFTEMPDLLSAGQAFGVLATIANDRGTDADLCQRWWEYNVLRYGKTMGFTTTQITSFFNTMEVAE